MYQDIDKLVLWKKAHQLTVRVYQLTHDFPSSERFGLSSQLRRAVSSVPTNIIEGKARNSNKDYLRFLYYGRASLEEAKYHLLLSKDLGYIAAQDYEEIINDCKEVGKMLNGLLCFIKSKSDQSN